MKNPIFLIFTFLAISIASKAQYFRITNDSILAKSELILENATKGKTGAFIRNKGNGRTDYAYAVDSGYIQNNILYLHRGDGWIQIELPTPATLPGDGNNYVNLLSYFNDVLTIGRNGLANITANIPLSSKVNVTDTAGMLATYKKAFVKGFYNPLNNSLVMTRVNGSDTIIQQATAGWGIIFANGKFSVDTTILSGSLLEKDSIFLRSAASTITGNQIRAWDTTFRDARFDSSARILWLLRNYHYDPPRGITTDSVGIHFPSEKIDTTSLSQRIDAAMKYSDTASALSPYLRAALAAATYQPIGNYPTVAQLNLKVNISDTASMLSSYLRSATVAATYQPKIKLTTNGSSGAATLSGDTLNIPSYSTSPGGITSESDPLSVHVADSASMLNPYLRKADSTLANRITANTAAIATKQGKITLTTTGTSGPATLVGDTLNVPSYAGGSGGWDLNGNTIVPGVNFLGSINNASLRFKTNNVEQAVLDSLGNFGLGDFGTGSKTPTTHFHLVDDNTRPVRGAIIEGNSSNNYSTGITIRKTRGNFASPSTVLDKDYLGLLSFGGYTPSGYINHTVGIGAIADGTVTSTSIPSDFYISTTPIGTVSPFLDSVVRVVVKSTGKVGIGTMLINPTERLHVGGKVRIDTLPTGTGSDSLVTVSGGVLGKIAQSSISGGSSGSTTDTTSLSRRIDRKPRVYNVEDYGAVHDGVTNDQPAIQAAINAAATAGGGKVWLPKGSYILSGGLVSGYNSQLYIPTTAFASRSHIVIEGEGMPNFTPIGGGLSAGATGVPASTGTVIKSTLTVGATGAAVIGTTFGSGFNYMYLTVQNIAIEVKNNPSGNGPVVGGINYKYGASLQARNVTVYIDTSGYRSVLPTNDIAGFETPDNSSETFNYFENTLAVGFRNGYRIGEHTSLDQAQTMVCYNSFNLKYGTHSVAAKRLGSYWSVNDIFVSDLVTNFSIQNLDVEWQQVGKWFDNVYTIKDTANRGKGSIRYAITEAFIGLNDTKFTQNGGSSIKAAPLATPNIFQTQLGVSSLPSDLNGASTNNIYLLASNSSYKNIGANDVALYSSGTNLSVLSDKVGSNINFATGGASTPQITIANTTDALSFTNDNSGRVSIVGQNTNAAGNTSFYFQNNRGSFNSYGGLLHGGQSYAQTLLGVSAADKTMLISDGVNSQGLAIGTIVSKPIYFGTNNLERASISSTGVYRINNLGAGTVTSDASGNLSVTSDERLKNIQGFYTSGLKELIKLKPIVYKWNKLSGNEMDSTYAGFSAQNVKANIPYGTGQNEDGYLTLQERALIATLTNSVKELYQLVLKQQDEIKSLKRRK